MNSMTRKAWLLVLVVLVTQLRSMPQGGSRVEGKGAVIQAPAGWSYNQRLAAAGGPINLTNFGGAYAEGGVLPPAGAEIEITSVPSPPNLVEYVRKELAGAPLEPLQEVVEGGNAGIRTAYMESMGAGASLKTVVEYVPHGPVLYKFYLSYWAGDVNEPGLTAAFSGVVKGAQLR